MEIGQKALAREEESADVRILFGSSPYYDRTGIYNTHLPVYPYLIRIQIF